MIFVRSRMALTPALVTLAVVIAVESSALMAQGRPKAQSPGARHPEQAKHLPGLCAGSAPDRTGEEVRAAGKNRWTQASLKVAFVDGNDPAYSNLRSRIERYAKEWEQFANIRFNFQGSVRTDRNGDITDRDLDIAIQLEPDGFSQLRTYQSLYGPDAHGQDSRDAAAAVDAGSSSLRMRRTRRSARHADEKRRCVGPHPRA